jgi:MFS family permease
MTVAAEPHSSRTKALTAAVIGNLVEWYEFTVYGFVAAVIGQLFFPSSDATTPLISSYAVFGLAFVVRPLDGLVFASIGDQFGRRNALAALLTLVSIATGAIGILPTYAAIGIAAPILLVACRMFQGFAFGGELAGTSTFILEYAPAGKRGLYTSMIGFTGGGGLILGALIVLLLQSTLSPDQFRSWGWRIPFVVGFIISFLGIYMRLRLEDTPVFRTIQQTNRVSHAPLLECVKTYWPTLILMFVFTSPQSLYFYLSAAFLLGYLIRDVGGAASGATADPGSLRDRDRGVRHGRCAHGQDRPANSRTGQAHAYFVRLAASVLSAQRRLARIRNWRHPDFGRHIRLRARCRRHHLLGDIPGANPLRRQRYLKQCPADDFRWNRAADFDLASGGDG